MKTILALAITLLSSAAYPSGDHYLLGSGYNSKEAKFTGRCVLPAHPTKLLKGGETTSTSTVDVNLSRDKLFQLLDLSIEGKVSLSEIQGSIEGAFALENQKNEFNLNQVFSWKLKGPSIGFVPLKMEDGSCGVSDGLRSMIANPGSRVPAPVNNNNSMDFCNAPTLTERYKQNDSQEFIESCGDSFVSQVNLGGTLVVSVNFEFKDTAVLTAFAAKGAVNLVDFFNVEAGINAKYESFKDRINIKISAIQMGGNVEKLSHILGNPPPGTESSDKIRVAVLKCAFNKAGLQSCNKAMSDILSYGKKEFLSSLNNMNYSETGTMGPAVVGYVLKSYKHGGFSELLEKDSGMMEVSYTVARKDIVKRGIEAVSYLDTTSRILGLSSLSETEKQKVNFEANKNEKNLEIIRTLERLCFDGKKDQCLSEYEYYIKRSFVSLKDQEIINLGDDLSIYPGYMELNAENLKISEDFLNLCQLYPEAKDNRSNFNTIARIAIASLTYKDLIIAKTSQEGGGYKINSENCGSIYKSLVNKKSLDLSYNTCVNYFEKSEEGKKFCKDTAISDLKPLKGFNSLENLYLEENKIFDISPVAHLSKTLTGLYLSGNKVSDVSVFKKMDKLSYLDLSNNNLYSRSIIGKALMERTNPNSLGLLRIDGKSFSTYTDDTGFANPVDFMNSYYDGTRNQINNLVFSEEDAVQHCLSNPSFCKKVCPADKDNCLETEKKIYRIYR